MRAIEGKRKNAKRKRASKGKEQVEGRLQVKE